MRRWFGYLLLAASAAVSLACASSVRTLLETEDDPGRPLRLRWQGTIRAEAGREGSWIEQHLEARFNVTFDPSFIVYFSYPRVLPIRLLGGDIPDVTWILGRDVRRFARHGFALELPWEVIQRHAPDYVRLLNAHAPEMWLITHADHKNFALPLFTIETRHPRPGYWRADWLRNVGLGVPQTLDEMEEALRRFRHNDPDRNGRKDTYGMCPWKPPISPETIDRTFEEVFAAYGVVTTGWMKVDGELRWGGVLPQSKEALARLRRWYAEELIYPEYVVVPPGSIDLIKKFTAGLVGYVYGLGEYNQFDLTWPPSVAAVVAKVHPGGEVTPAFFPRGPQGHSGGRGVIFAENHSALMFGAHLAESPEKVVRVLRMLNAMAQDEELFLAGRLGKRGLHWEWNEVKGLIALPPFDSRYHASRELLFWNPEPWLSWGYYVPFGASAELTDRFRTAEHRAFDAKYRRPEWAQYDALGQPEAVPSAELYLTDLVQLQVTVYSEIISGRKPLDAFDAFVRDWHRKGGDVLTREANALHRQRARILRRAGVEESR